MKLLLNILLIAAIFYFVQDFLTSKPKKAKPDRRPPRPAQDAELLVEDPTCGVYVPVSQAVRGPDDTWFCSTECLEAFKRKRG